MRRVNASPELFLRRSLCCLCPNRHLRPPLCDPPRQSLRLCLVHQLHLAPSWMLMNACVSVTAGLSTSDILDTLAVLFYFIEGITFLSPPCTEVTADTIIVNMHCTVC